MGAVSQGGGGQHLLAPHEGAKINLNGVSEGLEKKHRWKKREQDGSRRTQLEDPERGAKSNEHSQGLGTGFLI